MFYVALVAAFYASPYANLFFLLLTFLTVVLVANVWWTRSNLRGVEARVASFGLLPADTERAMPVEFTATRPRFRVSILAGLQRRDARCPSLHLLVAVPCVGPGIESRRVARSPRLERGIYTCTGLWLQSSYPFGLLSRRRSLLRPGEVAVYAEPLPRECNSRSDGVIGAPGNERLDGQQDLGPSALRDFREGDALRDVHWKASARRRQLVVRELDDEGAAGIELALDRRCDAAAFEHSLRVIVTVALRARDDQQMLAFHTQGLSAVYGEGQTAIDELLRWTASATLLPPGSAPPPPTSPVAMRLPSGGRKLVRTSP